MLVFQDVIMADLVDVDSHIRVQVRFLVLAVEVQAGHEVGLLELRRRAYCHLKIA